MSMWCANGTHSALQGSVGAPTPCCALRPWQLGMTDVLHKIRGPCCNILMRAPSERTTEPLAAADACGTSARPSGTWAEHKRDPCQEFLAASAGPKMKSTPTPYTQHCLPVGHRHRPATGREDAVRAPEWLARALAASPLALAWLPPRHANHQTRHPTQAQPHAEGAPSWCGILRNWRMVSCHSSRVAFSACARSSSGTRRNPSGTSALHDRSCASSISRCRCFCLRRTMYSGTSPPLRAESVVRHRDETTEAFFESCSACTMAW
jgi:hypothetical protein